MALKSGLTLIMLCAASAASAQAPAAVDAYRAINADTPAPSIAAIQAEAMTLLKTMLERKQAPCMPTRITVEAPKPATASRLAIDGINAGKLKNVWTTYGRLEGCPGTTATRFMVLRMADDSLLVRMVNTGETLTTTSQMRDTSANAAMAALIAIGKATPGCKGDDMNMGDTRVASRSPDLGPDVYGVRFAGSWREVWRFKACGLEADVPVDFRADGEGGVFTNIPGAEVAVVKR